MERTFRMLQNSFLSQTTGSHKKAVSLFTDSADKLRGNANAALAAIYVLFEPFFNAYISLNDAVSMLEGTYKGKTNLFEHLIDNVANKLREWEGPIRTLFPEDSSTEIEIFPNKRSPFLQGTYEQRLSAIRVLRDKLLEYTVANPSLVAVQADVAAYYTLCNTARQTQQGKEGSLNDVRSQREEQRVATANAYMGIVYGGLLQQFYTDIERVGDYIDFSLLYDLATEELIGDVSFTGPDAIANIPLEGVKVTAAKEFKIKVSSASGSGIVLAYFAATNAAKPGDPYIGAAVNIGDTITITAAELGFADDKTFLNFATSTGAEVKVELFEKL